MYRISSQNSLTSSAARNPDFYLKAVKPSKLIYSGNSQTSVLANSQRSIAQSNPESLDRPKYTLDAPSRAIMTELSPTTMNDRVDVHVEDQHNDSQLSFQNEDSKSSTFSEAPFEKSSHELLKCAATSTEEVKEGGDGEPNSRSLQHQSSIGNSHKESNLDFE